MNHPIIVSTTNEESNQLQSHLSPELVNEKTHHKKPGQLISKTFQGLDDMCHLSNHLNL